MRATLRPLSADLPQPFGLRSYNRAYLAPVLRTSTQSLSIYGKVNFSQRSRKPEKYILAQENIHSL